MTESITKYHNMDFNYDKDDEATSNYQQHQSPTGGAPPPPPIIIRPAAAFETEAGGRQRPNAPTTKLSELSLPQKKSSILGASSNLVNSIVGAGIIGIPYALRMSGLWAGVLLLLLVAALTDKSLRLLIEQASFHPKLHHLPIHTFEDLASYPYGKFGSAFILFNMFIMAYGAMIAYLLIIKDTIPTVLGYEHGQNILERNLILVATSLFIMVPLSMQRDMASLSCTSAISVTADVILVIFIAAFSPVAETVEQYGGFGMILRNDGINNTLFIGLGILSTAMACQHSAFIVANSLENKTRSRWSWVTKQSIGLSAILCAILGICGYLGFMGQTQGDVLNNFPLGTVQADGARILLAFTMFFTYPMESFVARHVLIMLIHNGDMDAKGGCTMENESRVEEEELGDEAGVGAFNGDDDMTVSTSRSIIEGGGLLCMNRRQTWTLLVYLSTLLPALIFSDIGPVLSITGAIGGGCISYIGPGLVYLGVNGEDFLNSVLGRLERWRGTKDVNNNSGGGGVTEEDLPVDGDASLEIDANSTSFNAYDSIVSGSKPVWYYSGLFPIWCAIANKGATHLKKKTDAAYAVTGVSAESVVVNRALLLPPPTKKDYAISLFFVCFGVVSAIAGVMSNLYVQWNNLDEVDYESEN
jgi:sodium-coupled neutral amino acid transporter 11